MTKRSDATREQLKQFRQERAAFREALAANQRDGMYSETYKDLKAAKIRKEHHDKLKVSARALYLAAQKNLSIAKTQLAGVQHDDSKRWDFGRLAFMRDEIAAKLAGAGGTGGSPLGGGIVQAIAALREQYTTAGDFHGERALRTVALPILAGIKPGVDSDSMAASTLRRQFADDEASMRPAEVDALEADIRELSRLTDEVQLDILAAEGEVTGNGLPVAVGPFGARPTEWAYDVLDRPRPAPIPERGKADAGNGKTDDPPKAQTDAEIVSQLYRTSSSAKPFGAAAVVQGAE